MRFTHSFSLVVFLVASTKAASDQPRQRGPGFPGAPQGLPRGVHGQAGARHRRGEPRGPPGAPAAGEREEEKGPNRPWNPDLLDLIHGEAESEPTDDWDCPVCKTTNEETETRCGICGFHSCHPLVAEWCKGTQINPNTPVWLWIKENPERFDERIYDAPAAAILEAHFAKYSGGKAPGLGLWNCEKCTFENPSRAGVCGMCMTRAPNADACTIIQNSSKHGDTEYVVEFDWTQDPVVIRQHRKYTVRRALFKDLSVASKLQYILVRKSGGVPCWLLTEGLKNELGQEELTLNDWTGLARQVAGEGADYLGGN